MDPPKQQEEENDIYSIDILEETIMEADEDMGTVKNESMPTDSKKILEDVAKRLRELNEEASILKEKKAKAEKALGIGGEVSSGASISLAEKEEINYRSIFVGNVDFACRPEEVQQHFQSCGTINRITILTDSFGQSKGYAYVEFAEGHAVQNALMLNETDLHGRPLRVLPKRTNMPGMKQNWGPFGYGNQNVIEARRKNSHLKGQKLRMRNNSSGLPSVSEFQVHQQLDSSLSVLTKYHHGGLRLPSKSTARA